MTTDTDPINLLRGWPCPKLLPTKLLSEAANHVLTTPSVYADALMYGPDVSHLLDILVELLLMKSCTIAGV